MNTTLNTVSYKGRQLLYTLDQADGAWDNGSIVMKTNGQPGDATKDGTLGVILGSIDVRSQKKPASYVYFLLWDGNHDVPVSCADTNNDGTPRLILFETPMPAPFGGVQ